MRVNEMADTLREVLATALNANLSVISVSQNKDTKRLAALAAIIAAPMAIARVHGMKGPNIDRDSGWRVLSDRTSDVGEEPAVIRATKEGSFLEKCKID